MLAHYLLPEQRLFKFSSSDSANSNKVALLIGNHQLLFGLGTNTLN